MELQIQFGESYAEKYEGSSNGTGVLMWHSILSALKYKYKMFGKECKEIWLVLVLK